MAGRGYLRVKPHTQIMIDRITVLYSNEKKKPHVSADTALWAFLAKCDPALAKEALDESQAEGNEIPDEARDALK